MLCVGVRSHCRGGVCLLCDSALVYCAAVKILFKTNVFNLTYGTTSITLVIHLPLQLFSLPTPAMSIKTGVGLEDILCLLHLK